MALGGRTRQAVSRLGAAAPCRWRLAWGRRGWAVSSLGGIMASPPPDLLPGRGHRCRRHAATCLNRRPSQSPGKPTAQSRVLVDGLRIQVRQLQHLLFPLRSDQVGGESLGVQRLRAGSCARADFDVAREHLGLTRARGGKPLDLLWGNH